jgi:hypothetical protein
MKLVFVLIGISLNLGCEIPDKVESFSVKENVTIAFVRNAVSF